MDIKPETMEKVTGSYKVAVTVESTIINIEGRYELDDYGSHDTLKTQVELAVRNRIGIEVLACKPDPKCA